MSRHLLGVLQPAVVFQVNGDAGCRPGVTSDGVRKAAALARFRIAIQALYRLRDRPVTAVSAELTLWNSGWPLRAPKYIEISDTPAMPRLNQGNQKV
jgi:hypothetical protein